jgi:hypothetical protein
VIAWFKNLLFERIEFELVSNHSLQDSIRILAERTSHPLLTYDPRHELMGSASKERVMVAERPFPKRNDFRPFFVGAFYQEGSNVVLRGVIRMRLPVIFFMLFWFGLTLSAITGIIATNPAAEQGVRNAGLLFFAFGFLLLAFGKRTWPRDVPWLREHLQKALQ